MTLKEAFLQEKSMKTIGKAINYEQPLLARPFYLNPRTRNAKSKDGFCHTESLFNETVFNDFNETGPEMKSVHYE